MIKTDKTSRLKLKYLLNIIETFSYTEECWQRQIDETEILCKLTIPESGCSHDNKGVERLIHKHCKRSCKICGKYKYIV